MRHLKLGIIAAAMLVTGAASSATTLTQIEDETVYYDRDPLQEGATIVGGIRNYCDGSSASYGSPTAWSYYNYYGC